MQAKKFNFVLKIYCNVPQVIKIEIIYYVVLLELRIIRIIRCGHYSMVMRLDLSPLNLVDKKTVALESYFSNGFNDQSFYVTFHCQISQSNKGLKTPKLFLSFLILNIFT